MNMLDSILHLGFWMNVEDCLTEFHHFPPENARARVDAYRLRLTAAAQQEPLEWMEDLIYHAEPWNVACDLANSELPLSAYLSQYQAILSRPIGVTRVGVQMERYG
jgi:hypothetical protein